MKTYSELKHLAHLDNVFITSPIKSVVELRKTHYELKHPSHLTNVFITYSIIKVYSS